MNLRFTKMHGLGNDFVVISTLDQDFQANAENIRFLADRKTGIGCDQVLLIDKSDLAEADFRYRIFNADGREVEQRGNGVRCVGEYLYQRELHGGEGIRVMTESGLVTLYRVSDNSWRVDMGVPVFEPADIPLNTTSRQDSYDISVDSGSLEFMSVSMGNPHAVLTVEDTHDANVEVLGPQVQSNEMFPEGVNVGFMQVLNPGHIRLRVYERGVGETNACGTGACAAVATGINTGRLDPEVVVSLNGGDLMINWHGEGYPLWMTGPATTVYEGQIEL